jgi:hypothetical protein
MDGAGMARFPRARRLGIGVECPAALDAHRSSAGESRVRCELGGIHIACADSPKRRPAQKDAHERRPVQHRLGCMRFGKPGNVPSVPRFPHAKPGNVPSVPRFPQGFLRFPQVSPQVSRPRFPSPSFLVPGFPRPPCHCAAAILLASGWHNLRTPSLPRLSGPFLANLRHRETDLGRASRTALRQARHPALTLGWR